MKNKFFAVLIPPLALSLGAFAFIGLNKAAVVWKFFTAGLRVVEVVIRDTKIEGVNSFPVGSIVF
jgi:hypothetical protein